MSERDDQQDLQLLLEQYQASFPEDVLVVEAPVSRNQEPTAIIDELERAGRTPMLYCPHVSDLDVPLLTNVFASRGRIARFLGTDQANLHRAYQRAATQACPPREIDQQQSPLEVTADGDAVDLRDLPLLTHFASDRGPYITNAVYLAIDPATSVANLSYHRSMIIGRHSLATSLHSRGDLWRALKNAQARNHELPVAVIMGAHPLFQLAASARVGPHVDERDIAGGLLGEPLDVVRTPHHGLLVPATAEFVLEGEISPTEHADEGPFGEFSGYSSHRSTNNVVRVHSILRRERPVLFDVAGGRAADHLNLGRIPREAEISERISQRFPDVRALHYPSSGTHFHAYMSIRPSMPGSARQAMFGLLSWDPYLKAVVAVDEDVDITNDSEVLWAVATRFQADRDLLIIGGLPGSLLDPSSSTSGRTARMAIDATRDEGFTGVPIEVSDEARHRAKTLLGLA